MDVWRYQQLQHFCTAHLQGIRVAESLTDFESLWLKQHMNRGMLSICHKLLNKRSATTGLRFFRGWETEFDCHFSDLQKQNM